MNKLFKGSMLVLVLFAQGAIASTDSANEQCNASDGLDGWSAWCGIDTYLTQQEPTAAGPIDGDAGQLALLGIVTDDFGGDLVPAAAVETPDAPVDTSTPLSNINELIAGNVIANYAGSGVYSGGHGLIENTIEVNFGNSTWDGQWEGSLNMAAEGSVTGSTFTSTGILGNPVVAIFGPPGAPTPISGTISGSFSGADASSLTGSVDIVHSGQDVTGTFTNDRVVAP